MKDRVFLSTAVATIFATASFVLLNYLRGGQVDWPSAVAFMIIFPIFFSITTRLFRRKNK